MTARDLTVFLADLTAYNRGVNRARRAYAQSMAEQEAAPDPRYCPCGAELDYYRQRCDTCRDDARRAQNRRNQRRYRARKAER